MIKKMIILGIIILAALGLLVTSLAPVQAGTFAMHGGNYILSVQSSPSPAVSSGGQYRLSPADVQAETGCCCKGFLPCIRK